MSKRHFLLLTLTLATLLHIREAGASRRCESVFLTTSDLHLPAEPGWFATKEKVLEYFPPIPMLKKMRQFDWQFVDYFTFEEKQRFLLHAIDGRLVNASGEPLTALLLQDFVIDADAFIYAYPSRSEEGDRTRHSSATAGGHAFFTGEIHISLGKITLITNSSGHYEPTDIRFIAALVYLDLIGIDLSQTRMRFFSGRRESAYSTGDSTVYDFLRFRVRGWQPSYKGATHSLE